MKKQQPIIDNLYINEGSLGFMLIKHNNKITDEIPTVYSTVTINFHIIGLPLIK